MDTEAIGYGLCLLIGVLSLVGLANLLDFGFRMVAESKAKTAEACRLRRWGLPARDAKEPARDERVWHFHDV